MQMPHTQPPGGHRVRWRRWPAVLAWGLWVLVMLGLPTPLWLNHLLRQAGYPYLDQLNQYASLSAVLLPAAVSAATVGVVLATRRPRHPVGWLLLILGLLAVTIGWAPQYALYGHLARPGAVPAPLHLGQLLGAWGVVPACLGFILLLTPTGSLPSPRWQWWARVLAAASLVYLVASPFGAETLLKGDAFIELGPAIPNPLFVPALALLELAATAAFLVILSGLVVGAASLVVRFRRARGVERQQLRWVGLATVLTGVAAGVYTVGVALNNPVGYVGGPAGYVTVMPIVIGAAVVRYRLYDLDRIISRTIAYGLLTVILGCGYAGVALGLGQLLGRGGSSLAVAGATLAVAAAFQPARHRIQGAVDRRFNRRRYDAARTIEAFSRRLRQEIDLDSLTAELAAVVNQTMEPSQVLLWLRPAVVRGAASAVDGAAAPDEIEERNASELEGTR